MQTNSRIVWLRIVGQGTGTAIVLLHPTHLNWTQDTDFVDSAANMLADRGLSVEDVENFRLCWKLDPVIRKLSELHICFAEAGPPIRFAIHSGTGIAACHNCVLSEIKQRLMTDAEGLRSSDPVIRVQTLTEIFGQARILAEKAWQGGWPD
jgi:hypothetical protein